MENRRFFTNWRQLLGIVTCLAVVLGALCFWSFLAHTREYVQRGMCLQVEAIGANAVNLLQSEVRGLGRLTDSAAALMNERMYQSDEDILYDLKHFAKNSELVRTLFITRDGHTYTSYAGYLGQVNAGLMVDGVPLEDITGPTVVQPFYAEDQQRAVFGVAAPASMGEKEGVLISSYDVDRLYDLFQNEFSGGLAQTGLVKQDGSVILGETQEREKTNFGTDIFAPLAHSRVKFTLGTPEGMRADMLSGRSGLVAYTLSGVGRYIAYLPAGVNDWYVMVMMPETALMEQTLPIVKSGTRLTIQLIVIMAAVLAAVLFILAKEEKKARKALQEAAMQDGLTQIYNRAATDKLMLEFFDGEEDGLHGLFMLDLDGFKQVNDTYGHPAGDCVLVALSEKLRHTFGKAAVVGRMGGDEFIALFRNCESREQVREKAVALTEPLIVQKEPQIPPVTVSVGVALFPEDGISYLSLYHKADKALYQAKRQGKNRAVFYCDIEAEKADSV